MRRPRPPSEQTGDLFGHDVVPDRCSGNDDWPDDYQAKFWAKYPPGRKYGKPKVAAKLDKLRRDKTVTWAMLWDGLQAFVASNPDEKFTPAPLVWLNQHRWTAYAGRVIPVKRQRLSFMDIAMGKMADGK